MRIVKIILFILLVLLIVFIVLGFLGPKQFDVKRTVTIDAPQEIVYSKVSNLSELVEWDPWKAADPAMEIHIHGDADKVGSYRRWESEQSGVGEQKLVLLDPPNRVETEMKFIKPFTAVADGYFDVVAVSENQSTLTMGFKGENGFLQRAFAMLGQDMDGSVGSLFESGLATVKEMAELKAQEQAKSRAKLSASDFSIGVIDKPAMSYVVKRDKIDMNNLEQFFSSNFSGIYMALGAAGIEPQGSATGIYYSWDEESNSTDMCAAVPVTDRSIEIEGYQTINFPAGRVAKLTYRGDAAGSAVAHYAMEDYLKANGLEQNGPVVEEYIVGANQEPDPSNWITDIYYRIK